MHNKFKDGSKVFVYGRGQENGKYYYKEPAIILERDPHFRDYHVRFKDGTEDWILTKKLRKPKLERKEIKENQI